MQAESQISSAAENAQKKFLTKVYGWMTFALFVSGLTSYLSAEIISRILTKENAQIIVWAIMILIVVEFVLVSVLSFRIQKMSSKAAAINFIIYSIINGITLSTIFFSYSKTVIIYAFVTSALTFLAMVLYGSITKADLRSYGKYLFMLLSGIIIASLVHFLLVLITHQSFSTFSLIISIATVVIFTGLTAYDSNKILLASQNADDSEMYKKAAVIGALQLYLDFINIFLALLKIFGKKRD